MSPRMTSGRIEPNTRWSFRRCGSNIFGATKPRLGFLFFALLFMDSAVTGPRPKSNRSKQAFKKWERFLKKEFNRDKKLWFLQGLIWPTWALDLEIRKN